MKKVKLHEALLFSGVFGFISYLLHDVIGSILYEGYNPRAQAVSDLTALNSPVRDVALSLSNLYGLFSLMTMVSILWVIANHHSKWLKHGIYAFFGMHLVSAIGYGLFPLSEAGQPTTFTDIMHMYVVTIPVVLLSIYALVCLIVFGKKDPRHRVLLFVASFALLMMFLGAMLSGMVDPSVFGIFERFSTYSAVFFTAFLGLYVFYKFKEVKNV